MIACPTIEKSVIRTHYDVTTAFYRLLWGPHIHHGLWEADESPARAQVQLTERLAQLAGIQRGERVLDVGCGMGGSSQHLAKHFDCSVLGVTISPFQQAWATCSAGLTGLSRKATFRCADAETVELPEGEFDVVWSIECTEHLFDKPKFFERVAGWLRPGGRVAICAWQAGDGVLDAEAERLVYEVCEGFFCPSLGSQADYREWMTEAGLSVTTYQDWTDRVAKTWEICEERIHRTRMHLFAKWIDKTQIIFLDRFQTILKAYRTGAMRYGCWVAEKPVS